MAALRSGPRDAVVEATVVEVENMRTEARAAWAKKLIVVKVVVWFALC